MELLQILNETFPFLDVELSNLSELLSYSFKFIIVCLIVAFSLKFFFVTIKYVMSLRW